jgi:hypothetical protein
LEVNGTAVTPVEPLVPTPSSSEAMELPLALGSAVSGFGPAVETEPKSNVVG